MGLENVLDHELVGLGFESAPSRGVRTIEGTLEDAYRIVMHSRVASRVLWPIAEAEEVDTPTLLYTMLAEMPFEEILEEGGTLAIDCVASRHRRKDNTRYLVQRAKDAIVDRLRDKRGNRPDIDRHAPSLRLHIRWANPVVISVDLGGALFRRGYRPSGARAPLRENLGAAMLLDAGYKSGVLIDPFCGSGTMLIEALLIARDIAPGLLRPIASPGWEAHDRTALSLVRDRALKRARAATAMPRLYGSDRDPEAVELAKESLRNIGSLCQKRGISLPVQCARFEVGDATQVSPDAVGDEPGHLVTNPPYGERVGTRTELAVLYARFGSALRERFAGWKISMLCGEPSLLAQLGMRSSARKTVFNGPMKCSLSQYEVFAPKEGAKAEPAPKAESVRAKIHPESEAFRNRLKKNLKRYSKLAKRQKLEAYRIYDRDIPEFNFAIDRYPGRVLVHEHRRPHKVDIVIADRRVRDVVAVCEELLDVPQEHVHLRSRGGKGQYDKRAATGTEHAYLEGGHTFLLNYEDYLDTGIFLDHRMLRAQIAKELNEGDAFLNLFAYTCSASVYAAKVGARCTSVDLSKTYLAWGERNFEANELPVREHDFVRSDVERFLQKERNRYRRILLNPPSYSRSKSTGREMILTRDHRSLIEASAARLTADGVLYFSTHARDFQLDDAIGERYEVREISKRTVPEDFARSPHRTWSIEYR